jgi:molybdenum cofactor cytidylyltransferase
VRALRIGCVVLAAGIGSRFGSDKRQAVLSNGSTVLAQTLTSLESVFSERCLVLRPGDDVLLKAYSTWSPVIAADAGLGMGHSLASVVPLLQSWDGMVVALGDMPWVRPETFAQVRDALRRDSLVVPFYEGERGNPVGIGSAFFADVAKLQGDQGARALFSRFAEAIICLHVQDNGVLRDVDTPGALVDRSDL